MSTSTILNGQYWAEVVRNGTDQDEVMTVIGAINRVTKFLEANAGAVIVACAQVLAQSISNAPSDIAPEIRSGIIALIDGYAMRLATEKTP